MIGKILKFGKRSQPPKKFTEEITGTALDCAVRGDRIVLLVMLDDGTIEKLTYRYVAPVPDQVPR